MKNFSSSMIACATILLGLSASIIQAAEPLRLVRRIPLGNITGRIDYLAADTDRQRLSLILKPIVSMSAEAKDSFSLTSRKEIVTRWRQKFARQMALEPDYSFRAWPD